MRSQPINRTSQIQLGNEQINGRANVLLVGQMVWPTSCDASKALQVTLRNVRVDRVQSARDAISWMRGRSIDMVVIDHEAIGEYATQLVASLRTAFPSAAIILVGELPSAVIVAEFFRMNITDWIENEQWADGVLIGNRVAGEIEKAMNNRVSRERMIGLENACRRLTQERKTLEEKLGGACANLAGAEESARDREGIAAMQAECRMLLAQENEVESIVELSTQYLIARVGPTNAAIFLQDQGQYRLAGYVRDDLARRAAGGLVDHLASLWCDRIAVHSGVVQFGPSDPPIASFAELAGVLPGRSVFAFACPNIDSTTSSAVVILFRDGQRPFSCELKKVALAVGPAMASGLARVRRIL
ncbi:MAG: hypothetical protein O2875_05060, partial [Planctomycetota bacterium]|nr:hypothetical protein [Planctomycetota bacterium]